MTRRKKQRIQNTRKPQASRGSAGRQSVVPAGAAELRGVVQLSAAAVLGTTALVEDMHRSIVSMIPIGGTAKAAALAIPRVIYRSIRGITRITAAGLDSVLAQAAPLLAGCAATSSPHGQAVLAALNGVLGDYLEITNNPLAISMSLRRNGEPLEFDRRTLASAVTPADRKLLVMVHGLCRADIDWNRKGDDHGSELARDLGYTPLFLHYNSGRRVSTNGREFADLMERLLRAWPAPVDELVIVGYSMGGLLARSACHYAERAGHRWPAHLKKLIFLGTPHHGAPMEQLGNRLEMALAASLFTTPLAKLGKIRSGGIKDLRYGNLVDEDWEGQHDNHTHDPRRIVPLPAGVECFAVAATRRSKPGRPGKPLPGDGLVPVRSALGHHDDPALALPIPESRQFTIFGLNHFNLRTSREVYDRIRLWLS